MISPNFSLREKLSLFADSDRGFPVGFNSVEVGRNLK